MASLLQKFFGTKSDKDIKGIKPILNDCIEAHQRLMHCTNDELRAKTAEFKTKIADYIHEEEEEIAIIRKRLDEEYDMPIDEKEELYRTLEQIEKSSYSKSQEILNEILPEAFAVVRETARRFKDNEILEVTASDFDRNIAARKDNVEIVGEKAHWKNRWMAGGNEIVWDMCHYDVQFIGGIILHQGKIAEMATGEGKTLVATLPMYLNALPGKGVHLVTVNDYLARRDSEWMAPIFEFHGLSVDCIDKHDPNSDERRDAYLADITYGTNNEFGFDYLRDNMARNVFEIVQRPHNYAIVDEVDSVLIDDARTPLIISGPTPKGDQQEFDNYKPIVEKLYTAQRTLVTKLLAEAKSLLDKPENSDEHKEGAKLLFTAHRGLPKNKALIKFLSESGMKQLLLKTEGFYMAEQNKNMHIIDDELFFVIDEKLNSVDIMDKGIDLVSTTMEQKKMFIIPDVGLAIADLEKQNLSATEKIEVKNEIYREFSIASERLHTIQQLMKAYTLFEIDVEYVIIDNKIKIVDEQTGRIMEGRRYSDGLHQAIEAKENVKVEAATQTYATITLQNYFRMYKKLAGMTGTAETEAGELWDIYKLDVVVIPTNKAISRTDKEDFVFKTKREKYNAAIEEIIELNKKGVPVLVGTTSVEISELISRMLTLRKIPHSVLNAKLHQKEADIVAKAGQIGAVTISTNMAGRGTDIKLGAGVKELGGLAIIGTERHDSRRVDRQLRGRAGRQGDPGSSQFYVSLEDDLMRLFGSNRIAGVMDRLGLKDGEVIQHSMITKSIERAQRKVEENNFGIRKRLLEYDDVMNKQRESIYQKRKNALYGDKLAIDISNNFYDMCDSMISEYQDKQDYKGFETDLISTFALENPFTEGQFHSEKASSLTDKLYEIAFDNYKTRTKILAERAFPIVKDVYLNEGHRYENIALPINDGHKTMQIIAPLKKCYETEGKEIILSIEKGITLAVIDDDWKEHLREMDELKNAVQNASYEQKDPLLIYKFESFELFKLMLQHVNKDIISFLNKGKLPMEEATNISEARLPKSDASKLQTGREDVINQRTSEPQKPSPVHVEKKVGRNDPCPCGSGKKYKNCHGKD